MPEQNEWRMTSENNTHFTMSISCLIEQINLRAIVGILSPPSSASIES